MHLMSGLCMSIRRLPLLGYGRRRWRLLTCLGLVCAICSSAYVAQPAQAQYVSPQFFGQDLMWQWNLNPAIPVHAMRLWSSNTDSCAIDSGTASGEYNFGQLDALLAQSSRLGADVEFTIGDTPAWAASGSYPQSSVVDQCAWGSST